VTAGTIPYSADHNARVVDTLRKSVIVLSKMQDLVFIDCQRFTHRITTEFDADAFTAYRLRIAENANDVADVVDTARVGSLTIDLKKSNRPVFCSDPTIVIRARRVTRVIVVRKYRSISPAALIP
jgi:hypothetical protein